MADTDRVRWDEKHAARAGEPARAAAVLGAAAPWMPAAGRALDAACGRGGTSVALAQRGLEVVAVDVSLVALAEVRRLADEAGVGRTVHTIVGDLDDGLPPDLGAFDVVVCVHFHAPRLWPALRAATAPGGVLVVETLTTRNVELGLPAPSPRFLAAPGEVRTAAGDFEVLLDDERVEDGAHRARLVARRRR